MKGKKFKLNGEDFYPTVLNYIIALNADKNEMWFSPGRDYNNNDIAFTKESALSKFKADMQLIKDMGFNAVRLGNDYQVKNEKICVLTNNGSNVIEQLLDNDNEYRKYLTAYSDMFKILDQVGLKAIVLSKNFPTKNVVAVNHLKKLLTYCNDEPAVLAWDFFNEPLYFDQDGRKKEEVYKIVKDWKQLVRTCSPNHLLTIGLQGTREVFEWDPNILDVDFISFHPYEFHKREVENELYWFNKYVKKPWIVGETGFSADNDSVSYDTQKMYAAKFLNRAINCGSSGFSWWQYKDVTWHEFRSDYLGLVNQKGTTQTSDKKLIANGTVKPAASIFKDLNPWVTTAPCDCLPNYYNYNEETQFAVIGKLIDETTGKPIEGGAIVAWNQQYNNSGLTFTLADGSFKLYANYKLYHYIASATLMNYVRDDFDWDKVSTTKVGNTFVSNIGEIKIKPLKLVD
jgi:hypothetical protein